MDFLYTAQLNMMEGNTSIRKINNNDNQIRDVYRIEFEAETEELNLSRVTYPKLKQTIKIHVQNLEHGKSGDVGVNITLIRQMTPQ